MAGGLEFGKLVAASYLHRYWNQTSFLLKTYLIIAVISLMGITSLGIFGFLTSAYQESHVKIEMIDSKKQMLETKKTSITEQIDVNKKRIEVLNDIRISQEQRVKEAGNYKLPREQAYAAIEKANYELNELQEKTKNYFLDINNIENNLLELKTEESKSTDIGTLKFVSNLFNTDIQTIVKWFTIVLVLVFDPLAVSLVLAYNNISKNKNILNGIEDTEKIDNENYQKDNKTINVKYKDK
jgi:seryl-tRNA synthetase